LPQPQSESILTVEDATIQPPADFTVLQLRVIRLKKTSRIERHLLLLNGKNTGKICTEKSQWQKGSTQSWCRKWKAMYPWM